MFELADIGYDTFFSSQVGVNINEDYWPARIASEHRGEYDVWSSRGEERAKLSAPFFRKLSQTKGSGLPGVGDWVAVNPNLDVDGLAIIEQIYERRSVFTRGAAGGETRIQVVSANVDFVLMVSGLDDNYNIRRIERYLARIWASGAAPAVVLNKADLCQDPTPIVQDVKDACEGVPVYVISALEQEGISLIRDSISGAQTAVLVGSSGTGKSTLINALCNEQRMETAEVREKDSKGRHTTTRRQLILLPEGGMIIDTPGMRELAVFDDEGLDNVFFEIEALTKQCKFGNCSHGAEPACAVRAALEAGTLELERFENYQKMDREAKDFEERKDIHERRKSDKAFGKMVKVAKRLKRSDEDE